MVVTKTLPIFLSVLSGERAIGEPLDLADGVEETFRAGNEFIADEVEKEGMVGDWDRLESRSVLGSVTSFSMSPCPDVVISSMMFSSFSCEYALSDTSRLFSSTCSEDILAIFNILGITSLAFALTIPIPFNNCLGGGDNDTASNSTEGDLTIVQSSSIFGGG